MMNQKLFHMMRKAINYIKYLPILLVIAQITQFVALLSKNSIDFIYLIVNNDIIIPIILLAFSKLLQFCRYHRMCIYYLIINSLLLDFIYYSPFYKALLIYTIFTIISVVSIIVCYIVEQIELKQIKANH